MVTSSNTPNSPRRIATIESLDGDRFTALLFGQEYELNTQEDLDLVHLVALRKRYKRYQEIMARDAEDLTEEEAEDLADAIQRLFRALVRDCPEEIHARLNDQQRMIVLEAFSKAAGLDAQARGAQAATKPRNRAERRSTGIKPSPSSAGSTAGPRRNG